MKKGSLFFAVVVIMVSFLFSLNPTGSFAGDTVVPLEKAERPTWNVGDIRTYSVIRSGGVEDKKYPLTMTVIGNDGKEYAVVLDYDGKKIIEYYNLDLNYVRTTDEKGTEIESAYPEIAIFKWPLKPGNWWNGGYSSQSTTTEVIGPETLTNAAGEKVATLRLTFKRFTGRSRNLQGKRDVWYDPASKFILKRVDERSGGKNEIRELISFTPGVPK